jgi:hypothetical protein
MKEASFIVPRLLDRGMSAVISMSHGYKDVKMDYSPIGEGAL